MKLLLTGASGFLGGHVLGILRHRVSGPVMLGRTHATDSAFAEFVAADLLATPDFSRWSRPLAPATCCTWPGTLNMANIGTHR